MLIYNLLDVLKFMIMHQSLISAVSLQLLVFLSLPVTLPLQLIFVAVVFSTLYFFRCRHLFNQLATLHLNRIRIDKIGLYSQLIDHKKSKYYLANMHISKHDAMAQKMVMFYSHLLTFYITNHQIIITLSIFLPIHAVPIILSRLSLFLLAFGSAYLLSCEKVRLLSMELEQSQHLYSKLKSLTIKQSKHPNKGYSFLVSGIIYFISIFCLLGYCVLIEQSYHILTVCGLLTLAGFLIVTLNNTYCMSMLASISNITSMLTSLPQILKLHQQALLYFFSDFLDQQAIYSCASTIYSTLSLLCGVCIYRQAHHRDVIKELLDPVKSDATLPSKSLDQDPSPLNGLPVRTPSNQNMPKNNH